MQMTLEMLYKDRFYIDKPVRLIELFCGIGAFSKALTRLGVEFETYRAIDFDKYKIQGFNAIHGANFDTTDITELRGEDLEIVDTEKYCYVMSYSYPCQDLSMAGKRQGMAKGSGTRSGLLWEVERLLTETEHLPQVLIMENVPEVRRGINKEHFSDWVRFLESLGYTSYAEDLNAKNYGVPQNRNRTFMVSLLDGYFTFPEPFELKERLRDRLETDVDESYFLSDAKVESIKQSTFGQRARRIHEDTAGGGSLVHSPQEIGKNLSASHNFKPTITDGDGISIAIDTAMGSNRHTSQYISGGVFQEQSAGAVEEV